MRSSLSILSDTWYSLVKPLPERRGWARNVSDRVVEGGDEVLEYGCLREDSLRPAWFWRRSASIVADGHHHTAEDEQHQEVKSKELVNLPNGLEDQLDHGSKCMPYCNKVHHLQNDQDEQKAVQKCKQHDR